MNIDGAYITALEALGYTEQEARFLYLVATHSGYFVARQFLGFAGVHWGKRTTLFWNKLRANKHARSGSLPRHGVVYHLCARRLYWQLGRENLPNRRRHELENIQTRIAILDFVLANPSVTYLETEPQKVDFLCRELGIDRSRLPSKTYFGHRALQPTVRYFVDGFPMFIEEPHSTTKVLTFSFIQGSEATLAAFIHHLQNYLNLFRELSEFRFLYLARTDLHFAKARELFHGFVAVPLSNSADDLLRYFAIRKAWELHDYASVTEADLVFRNLAKERFAGERFEHFYRAWKADRISESHIRRAFQGHPIPHVTHFEARILSPFSRAGKESEGQR